MIIFELLVSCWFVCTDGLGGDFDVVVVDDGDDDVEFCGWQCILSAVAYSHELFSLPFACGDRADNGDAEEVVAPSAAAVACVATCWTPFSMHPS